MRKTILSSLVVACYLAFVVCAPADNTKQKITTVNKNQSAQQGGQSKGKAIKQDSNNDGKKGDDHRECRKKIEEEEVKRHQVLKNWNETAGAHCEKVMKGKYKSTEIDHWKKMKPEEQEAVLCTEFKKMKEDEIICALHHSMESKHKQKQECLKKIEEEEHKLEKKLHPWNKQNDTQCEKLVKEKYNKSQIEQRKLMKPHEKDAILCSELKNMKENEKICALHDSRELRHQQRQECHNKIEEEERKFSKKLDNWTKTNDAQCEKIVTGKYTESEIDHWNEMTPQEQESIFCSQLKQMKEDEKICALHGYRDLRQRQKQECHKKIEEQESKLSKELNNWTKTNEAQCEKVIKEKYTASQIDDWKKMQPHEQETVICTKWKQMKEDEKICALHELKERKINRKNK